MDAGIKLNGILLNGDLLLNQSIDLLFEEVALIDIISLQLLVVLLKVGDVLNDLLQDIISSLGGVVLKCSALRTQELHFLLVVIQQLDRFFRVALNKGTWRRRLVTAVDGFVRFSGRGYYLRQGH